MSRFRWYHYYFLLAFFDVVVIVLSLRLHQQAVDHVQELLDAQTRLDTEAKMLQSAQKAVMELNAPGNDLFGRPTREEFDKQRRRFDAADRYMTQVLAQIRDLSLDETRIALHVDGMKAKARELFSIFQPLAMGDASKSADVVSVSAGPVMRDMDNAQHEALHAIASLSNANSERRRHLIEQQQVDLSDQFRKQSFIIAGVLIILVGVLFFGRQLQEADKALTLERERVKEARRERLAAIGELCSSVAHGIRNPLAAIRSSAQLALELGQLDGGTRERIQDILDEGRRLGDRVTGLLSIARVNADSFGEIDLTNVVNVGIKGLLPEIERQGLTLETEISDEPVLVSGDRPRLEQCVVEYLSNAMEHSPAGGTIRVSCGIEADSAVIAVEDEGPGVPKAVRERVFDLFFTTKPAGTGIGLATVMRIAKLHGGDAGLDDVSAGGARFTFKIPTLTAAARNRADRGISRGNAAA
ncbi:MAG: hypothetical protein H6818_19210 [Phycisphaerales bacterium]|nr:hypothetical protein [Phycisphaerales bacterium]